MPLLASSIDLTTVAAVKDYVEVASTADNDLIQIGITAFSRHVLDRTGRDTLNSIQTFTEIRNGTGSERMFMRNYPIQTVTSLIIGAVTQQLSAGFGSAGYFIEQSKKSIAMRSGSMGMYVSPTYPMCGDPFFVKGIGNVQVVYTAGYSTVPPDLEWAARCAVAVQYKRRQWIDLMSKTLSAGGASGTTRYRDWKFPKEVEQVLVNYTRVAML